MTVEALAGAEPAIAVDAAVAAPQLAVLRGPLRRVLLVNHTARVSGAERSLLDLAGALPAGWEPVLAAPEGDLAQRARAAGLQTISIPAVDAGLRAHPLHAARAGASIAAGAVAVARAARRCEAAVVHANSVRAGLVAVAAARLGAPRPVVHVRDCVPASPLTARIRRAVDRGAAAVVANSAHTARSWGLGRRNLDVVRSPVDLRRFDPALADRAATRAALGVDQATRVLAVVGQITPWKGQDDAIRACALLRGRGLPVRLLVVGGVEFDAPGTSNDNRAYAESLPRLGAALGIADAVSFLGRREDVPALLAAADVLLVPSWEEPLGRTVLEGMAMGRPVVATDRGGPAELIEPGHTGFLAPPRAPEVWADTVEKALRAGTGERIGAAALDAVRAFGLDHHVAGVCAVYDRIAR